VLAHLKEAAARQRTARTVGFQAALAPRFLIQAGERVGGRHQGTHLKPACAPDDVDLHPLNPVRPNRVGTSGAQWL
jgi:hypothetical protein